MWLCLFIPILNKRISDKLRLTVSRKFGSNVWILDTILTYLSKELQAKERSASFKRVNIADTDEQDNHRLHRNVRLEQKTEIQNVFFV